MWRVTGERQTKNKMDVVKGCLSVRGLTIQEAKGCVKARRGWRRIKGGRGDVDDPA